MVRMELRVVLATVAIFIALGGIGLSIHGSLYYLNDEIWMGVIAIVVGIVGCVTMLTLWPRDLPGKTPPEHPPTMSGHTNIILICRLSFRFQARRYAALPHF